MRKPLQGWIGDPCTLVDRDEAGAWYFGFNGGGTLTVRCVWRILNGGRIVLSRDDDGQLFGRPAPVDALGECRDLLVGRTVARVVIADVTADLMVSFDSGAALQVLNTSGGYEGWLAVCPSGGADIAGLGGGGWARV